VPLLSCSRPAVFFLLAMTISRCSKLRPAVHLHPARRLVRSDTRPPKRRAHPPPAPCEMPAPSCASSAHPHGALQELVQCLRTGREPAPPPPEELIVETPPGSYSSRRAGGVGAGLAWAEGDAEQTSSLSSTQGRSIVALTARIGDLCRLRSTPCPSRDGRAQQGKAARSADRVSSAFQHARGRVSARHVGGGQEVDARRAQ